MSGHSKWSSIKRAKGISDARRGALFTKLTREIMVSAREGGGDPAANFRLRLAVTKARESNMPLENIDRAIKKASGEAGANNLEEITYEGRGPNGVALIIEAMTDNRNRTVADLRAALVRAGGSLSENGSSAFLFDQRGVITIEGDALDADAIFLTAADAGAEDVHTDDGAVEVYTPPDRLDAVRQAMEAETLPIASAELSMIPTSTVDLDRKASEQLLKLLEKLDDLDDVQKVYTNAEFSEEALADYQG